MKVSHWLGMVALGAMVAIHTRETTAQQRDILRNVTIPIVDIAAETERHVIIAQGTETAWQGHPSTLLLPDGKTMFCAWQARLDGSREHGAPGGMLKRSDDGGKTWSELLKVPANWREIGRGHPTLHRLMDAKGVARLFIFSRDEERTTFLVARSDDEGKTWTPTAPIQGEKLVGWTAPITILPAEVDGIKHHLMWYERDREGKPSVGVIWQAASKDGGLTWGDARPVVDKLGASEPAVVRSPDGKQLLMLIRENSRKLNSLYAVSNDEGRTWSEPKELPGALTGDRHLARYAKDGRLVVMFRDRFLDRHSVAWVGRYEDIVEGREGQYRVKLLHSHAGADHTYPGLEVLPDGTFVATTYIKYQPGPEQHSVVAVRFKLQELDEKLRLLTVGRQ